MIKSNLRDQRKQNIDYNTARTGMDFLGLALKSSHWEVMEGRRPSITSPRIGVWGGTAAPKPPPTRCLKNGISSGVVNIDVHSTSNSSCAACGIRDRPSRTAVGLRWAGHPAD